MKYVTPFIEEAKLELADVIKTSGELLYNEVGGRSATNLGGADGQTLFID